MQAIINDVDGQPAVGTQRCNVRRLSTPSFTENEMLVDSYLTQWRWYWKDDCKKWNMYNKVKTVHICICFKPICIFLT